ncbi:MAG TPA: DUF2330 domain-containing protein [Polyangiaceae bacterium]
MKRWHAAALTFLSPLLILAHPATSEACGGCFVPQVMTSVVTAHRMAFAFSTKQTVLWDQIQYSGDPKEFSWVLPIRGDAKVEPAHDAWFETLETVTNTRISPPQLNCFVSSSRSGGGCACGGDDSSSDGFAARGGSTGGVIPGVMVTHEGTVGPYYQVQLSATSPQSLLQWLAANGYVIPPDVQPVIAAYVQENFNFIALKLRPGLGTRQMTPVRVITPNVGGSAILPLRMVAAGTGAEVAITLYVISEGRYEPEGFGRASVDFSKLSWDWQGGMPGPFGGVSGRSNYSELRAEALKADGGKTWLTSFSFPKGLTRTFTDAVGQAITFNVSTSTSTTTGGFGVGPGQFENLTDLYFAQAAADSSLLDICSTSKISARLETSSLVRDTCHDAPSGGDAGVDGGTVKMCDPAAAGELAANELECNGFTDVSAAFIGMHPNDVWLTRLEANLPHAALATDLTLHAEATQAEMTHVHRAVTHVNPPCDLLENHPEAALFPDARQRRHVQEAGIGFLSAFGLFFARRLARRKRSGG